jgi:hypothetical protein
VVEADSDQLTLADLGGTQEMRGLVGVLERRHVEREPASEHQAVDDECPRKQVGAAVRYIIERRRCAGSGDQRARRGHAVRVSSWVISAIMA